ncbi:hypothetical protein LPJ66_005877 [Kickxella alabastrina]|uniref:Uncharacterized protein n=1 Tax=Kickxella alabastrina TaxID=61397 RepID=A0ACC1IDB9_9FUNG|nr:hypothetical protein LPJ66_005877 [Kickxella alabastrina]
MKAIVHSLSLVAATLVFWAYGLHLYRAANQPLVSLSASDSLNFGSKAAIESPTALTNNKEQQNASPLASSNDGILTFIHASDLHISKYFAKGGLIHFLHFLHTAVPLISPRLVAVTGDLTDGKDRQRLTSLQQIDEWQAYQRALNESHVKTRLGGNFYRDQRGNHDCFNVFSFNSSDNYYKDYSAVQEDGYLLQIREPFGTYSFVASDGCPRHGFARPMNFFGYLDAYGMEQLERRMEKASGSSHVFLLNHYPVSTMLYGKYRKSFGELVNGVSVFLCGHLHYLAGGIGAQLQAYKAHDGYWELEIGDMKEHAVYRVYAIDNDLVAFVDVILPLEQIPMPNPQLLDAHVQAAIPHPPVVLVTNPKDARYLLPKHEPLGKMLTSTHIRVLIWTDSPVASVSVKIDGHEHPHKAEYRGKETGTGDDVVKTPLWVVPWDAAKYDDGSLHEIQVTAVDSDGKTTTVRLPFHFSLEPLSLENDSRGGWIMRQNFADIFRISGLISYLLMVLFLLLIPRLVHCHLKDPHAWLSRRRLEHHKDDARMRHIWATFTRGNIVNPFVLVKLLLALLSSHTKFCVWTQFTAQVYFASIPWLYWPAYFFAMALATMPLFTGHLIPSAGPNGIGSVYVYGIYIAGEWAPLLDSWLYALTSIASLALLLLYVPVAVSPWSIFYPTPVGAQKPWYRSILVRLAMASFITLYLGVPTIMTVYTYGFISIVLGPGRAWLFIAAAVALYTLDWSFTVPSPRDSYSRVPVASSEAAASDEHVSRPNE